jgi:predicted transglutaminase-like cysteine proteinase
MRIQDASSAVLALMILSSPSAHAQEDAMGVGPQTLQPIGHHALCARDPRECLGSPDGDVVPTVLSPEILSLVAETNTSVNVRIHPRSDKDQYGIVERWDYPVSEGDCEDYALLKRRILHEAGIPLSNLLMTVVRKRNGEGHAVLTLRTSKGDFILDNLDWTVRPWRKAPYTFVKRQDERNPGIWRSIQEDAPVLVGSVAP